MKRLSHIFKTPIFRSRLQPREFSPGPLLNSIDKLEEERLPWYSEKNFFPVKIGDIYSSRYQVVGKLGYGGYSTVWLCRDLKKHSFVTLKLFEPNSSHAKREIEAYEHLKRLKSKHTGTLFVRSILDKFQLSSLDNSTSHSYQCLIHPPLAMSLYELRRKTPEHSLPEDLLKPALIHLLLALDFLHTEAHMIHTDIQEKNIMLSIEEESILLDFENAEISSPSPRKQVQDRSIYLSRKLGIPKIHGHPVLADFGEARFGSECGMYKGDVQPFIYRAPEVVLRLPWDEKIDIWNVAVLAWDIFEKRQLFKTRDTNKEQSDSQHFAETIGYMGLPPLAMIGRSDYAKKFFDASGKWRDSAEVPLTSLEEVECILDGENQVDFLRFMRRMLKWEPNERASAKELLSILG